MVTATIYEFGDFKLDCDRFELYRAGRSLKLERKPMELLVLLATRNGHLVMRAEIAERLWDKEVFVDTEHGINTAIRKIREVLHDDPVQSRFVQTVTGKGYRFTASVVEVRPPLTEEESQTSSPESSVRETGAVEAGSTNAFPPQQAATSEALRSRSWRFWIWPVALVAAAVLIFFVVRNLSWRGRVNPKISSLAVLPLANLSGDPAQDYFADGMTDELITELARIPTLRVVSRTSVMQDKGSRKPLPQIARELNVDAIVEGSVVRSGDKVRITAQLIDARSDRHLWAQSFESEASDILFLQDSVAREIASRTRAVLTPPAGGGRNETMRINPAADDAYLRGRYFLNKRDALKSTEYFQQAISLDPSYASAYAGLADSYESQSLLANADPKVVMPKALAAAKRAIELDPKNGEAYTALGSIQTTYEWNWAAAGENLTHGINLSPSYSLAEMRYAVYLDAMDRPEAAVTHMRRALELDPLSFLMNRHLGSTLFFARHYDEALYYLRRAGEMEPNQSGVVENWISWIYEKKGMQDDAVAHDLIVLREYMPGTDVDRLHSIYQRAGWKAYWQARIDMMSPLPQGQCRPYILGVSYVRLGDRDRAFSWLNRAVDEHCFWLMWLKVDPLVDDIRIDKRYSDLLRRLNLSE